LIKEKKENGRYKKISESSQFFFFLSVATIFLFSFRCYHFSFFSHTVTLTVVDEKGEPEKKEIFLPFFSLDMKRKIENGSSHQLVFLFYYSCVKQNKKKKIKETSALMMPI
jgi:hypothetical protein